MLLSLIKNTHLIKLCGMEACIPFCHKPSPFIYYLSDASVLSKYLNTLRKLSEFRIRDVRSTESTDAGLHVTGTRLVTFA